MKKSAFFYAGMIVPTYVSLWKSCRQTHSDAFSSTLDCFSDTSYSFRSRAAHSLRLDFIIFLESNTCPKVLSRLTTPLTLLCCEKSQCVHDLSDQDCSQSNLPHISIHTSAKVFFLLFNSTIPLFLLFIFVLLPGKFPIFSFSFFLFLCAFHLYLTTLTLQNLFYPWLHGRRGKRKRKKDNERKKNPPLVPSSPFFFVS